MEKKGQYRRLLRALFCAALLLIYAFLFWHVWNTYYSPRMERQFYERGHWLFLGVYLFGIFSLVHVYGGWKVGYLRVFDFYVVGVIYPKKPVNQSVADNIINNVNSSIGNIPFPVHKSISFSFLVARTKLDNNTASIPKQNLPGS